MHERRRVLRRRLARMAAAWIQTFLVATPVAAQAFVHGSAGVATRGFFESPLRPEQVMHTTSVLLRPSLRVQWGQGAQRLTLEPLVRLDEGDGVRMHFDLRALAWERAWPTVELRLGIARVFWGVAESQHLVDIVNQRDLVERPNRKEKLGQPMVDVALKGLWGTLDLYLLPGFRRLEYPSSRGRLRGSLPVASRPEYASRARDRHVDVAARWHRASAGLEVAISGFRGTSRDPVMMLRERGDERWVVPRYEQIDQLGLEARYVAGAWTWKVEALSRGGLPDGRYSAMVAGVERTMHRLFGSGADLALLTEYHRDERGREAPTAFQNDGASTTAQKPPSGWGSWSTGTRGAVCTWPRHGGAWLRAGAPSSRFVGIGAPPQAIRYTRCAGTTMRR
jgi:hypothetical protein